MDTPSTNETSVRVVRNNNESLTKQDTACPLVRTITMEQVSKQTLSVVLGQMSK